MDEQTQNGRTGEVLNGAGPGPEASDATVGSGIHRAFAHRAGIEDDTPPGGTPAVEPPLWREAARHAPTSPAPPGLTGDAPEEQWYGGREQPGRGGRHAVAPEESPLAAGFLDLPSASEAPAELEEPDMPDVPTGDRGSDRAADLPRRVPAEPDVPDLGDPPGPSAPAEAPELARIATQLRRDDIPAEGPADGFDVDAVLDAVRGVAGVRAAALRASHTGSHTLRLDLAESADPVQVSRVVARLLQERMGLSAAPQHVPRTRTPEEVPAWGGPVPASTTDTERDPAAPTEQYRSPAPGGLGADPPSPEATGTAQRWPGTAAEAPGADPPATAPPATDPPATDPSRSDPDGCDPAGASPDPGTAGSGAESLLTGRPGPRVLIDHVQINVVGLDATVEVRLAAGHRRALGLASGPAIDSYVVRLAAVSAAEAVDKLMGDAGPPPAGERVAVPPAEQGDDPGQDQPSRCFVEHTGVVPFGGTEVAVVVVLLVCGGWVEQLAGSAVVDGDARHAAVRATLGAVNRRLDALLAG